MHNKLNLKIYVFIIMCLPILGNAQSFITTWDTTKPGVSSSTSITIPTGDGLFDYDVDWDNDGVFDEFSIVGDITHDFEGEGIYTIRIQGDFPSVQFNNSGDKDKIIDIVQWGNIQWESLENAFYGCNNLNSSASDTPDLSDVLDMTSAFSNALLFNGDLSGWNVENVTKMKGLFMGASNFNQDITGWDVSAVEDMSFMFSSASEFDQNLGAWQIPLVQDMTDMFSNSNLSIENYDLALISWSNQTVQSEVTLGAIGINYCGGESARIKLMSSYHWDISDNGKNCPYFMLQYDTSLPGETNNQSITIPTIGGSYDVDWDFDGIFDDHDLSGTTIHEYDNPGIYNIMVKGDFPRIYFNNSNDKEKLISVLKWGENQWLTMEGAFHGCSNMVVIAPDIPDLSNVTNMSSMFRLTTNFNGFINNWNVSGIQDMSFLFAGATSFNSMISNWDISSVLNMTSMFENAASFDQSLGGLSLASCESAIDMLSYSGLSISNYDNTIIGWLQQGVPPGLTLGAHNLEYCIAEADRLLLSTQNEWSFVEDKKGCPFITRWNTNFEGETGPTEITIPTFEGESYNYDIDWNNDGVFDNIGVSGTITHDYGVPGIYDVAIRGEFPRIHLGSTSDNDKLIDVISWGSIEWTSMAGAFSGCENLEISTIESPNLSIVTSMQAMFIGSGLSNSDFSNWDVSNIENMSGVFAFCPTFNGDIITWNVSNVTTMEDMFSFAYDFNSDISNWDVSSVTTMSKMFSNCSSFNQSIGSWDVSEVIDMSHMFSGADLFNQDLNSWDVSMVEDMSSLFAYTDSFNQDLNSWDVSNVIDMIGMFSHTASFNGNISNWDVSNLVSIGSMFLDSEAFNQDLNSWDVSNVLHFHSMFRDAQEFSGDISSWDLSNAKSLISMFSGSLKFNSDISSWDVSNISNMSHTFSNAKSFDQNIGNWDISAVTNFGFMLSGSGLSTENYDNVLIGWKDKITDEDLYFSATGLTYCKGEEARQYIIDNYGWNIANDTKDCSFAFTVNTENPGTSSDNSFSIPTTGGGYNYDIDWDNDGVFDQLGAQGSTIHTYAEPGIYTIRIQGDFPRIYFDYTGDSDKIIDINQWGDNEWTSMRAAFGGCTNLNISAIDAPNLSNVTDMSYMLGANYLLTADINHWDVSNVTDMSGLFSACSNFNSDLDNWDVSSVLNMSSMFIQCYKYNRDLNSWNVSNVETMKNMFADADKFNGNISNWDVSSVTNLEYMFWSAEDFAGNVEDWNVSNATSMKGMFGSCDMFNSNISGWDVSNVVDMAFLFHSSNHFDHQLGDWNVSNVNNAESMFTYCGMSQQNYDATLIGWSTQQVESDLELGATSLKYCAGELARTKLINDFGWDIIGDSKSCPTAFVTTWKTDNPGISDATSITIPAAGPNLNYHVDWNNDGVYDQMNISGSVTFNFLVPGTYTISIIGDIPRIAFNNSGDKEKLLSIDLWGDNEWTSMANAFYGCNNLTVNATNTPNLSSVENMQAMFRNATSFNSNINDWDVSNVSNMSFLFSGAESFNQPLNSWDVSNVDDLSYMFYNAENFNWDISSWDVSNVNNMYGTFWNASSFNGQIGVWETSAVTDMRKMFDSASSFDQPLGDWDITNVTQMSSMLNFSGLSLLNYDQTLIGWANQNVLPNISLGADLLEYCSAQVERDYLINDKGWNIMNDLLGCAPCGVIEWIGATDIWSKAEMWDLNRIPLACDDVIISEMGNVTIETGEVISVNSVLNLGSLLLQSNSQLKIITENN